jgi:hypothetical protein
MKNLRIILIFICIPFLLFAQDNVIYNIIQEAKLSDKDFRKLNFTFVEDQDSKQIIESEFIIPEDVYYMKYDNLTSKKLDDAISLFLSFKNDSMELELLDFSNTINNYEVVTSDGMRISANKNIRHYRGIVKNKINSFAALTFLNDEVIGLITTEKGNFNISFDQRSGNHILFRDDNLKKKIDFRCNTIDDYSFDYEPEILSEGIRSANNLNSKSVSFYFETENDIFQIRGSVASVEGFVTGIYNQVAGLYQNEGIQTNISEIFIWTTEDPYTATNTAGLLTQFQNERTSINANLGHLLTFRRIGGGQAAGFQGLCSTNTTQKLAVSMLYNNYQSVPIFSWSVFVITHEFGHLFGSRHTHACVWNGNNTAIDGCAGTMEGSCPNPGNPSEGGTIMSYCHLQDVGVNFNLGFGPQPRNVIQNNVNNCVAYISGPSLICTTGTYTINNFPEGATVNWRTSPQLTITSGQVPEQVIVSKLLSISPAFVYADITINGNTFTVTKSGIQVGTKAPSIVVYNSSGSSMVDPPYYTGVNYRITAHGSGLASKPSSYFAWEVEMSPGRTILYNGYSMPFSTDVSGSYVFKLRYYNPDECGWSDQVSRTIHFAQGSGRFSLYPNPASDLLTVGLISEDNMQASADEEESLLFRNSGVTTTFPYRISLWHERSGLVRTVESTESVVQISLQGLPKGMYFVHVQKEGEPVQKQILWVR